MALWQINCERQYIVELRLSPGIHACFELRMDASKVRSIRGSDHYTIVHELWLTIDYCFRLFCVDSGQIYTFSTGERESSTLTHWAVFFTGHLTTETFVCFALRSLYHQNGFDPSSIKLLFFGLMLRWLHLSVSKYTFEACFACSTQYF